MLLTCGNAGIGVFQGVLVSVIVAVGVGMPALRSDAEPPLPGSEVPGSEAAALAQAQDSGERVEVRAATTETRQVFANPSGTLTMEQTARPARVRRGGGWVPVDTRLVRRADGRVAPAATTVDVSFSGGGSAPLARISRGASSLSLSWPAPLPQPVVEADTATYVDVLPDVDLVVHAEVDSFSEVLVVKTPAAASSPALRAMRFATESVGVRLRPADGGGFDAVDASGTPVFSSPEPLAWDSSAGSDTAAVTAVPGSTGFAAAAGSAEDPRVKSPQDGDRVLAMKVELDAASVTVRPDAAMLADPSLQFPLYLDPTVGASPARTLWAMVNKSYPSRSYVKWGNGTNNQGEGVGFTNRPETGVHTKRLYWMFDTRPIAGKVVYQSKFRAFETHADTCTKSQIKLELTSAISTTTNWNNQPTWKEAVSSLTTAVGRNECKPGGERLEFDAKHAATRAANGRWPTTTLRLIAGTETNRVGWKRFRNDAQWSVEYNTPPPVPVNIRTTMPATSCVIGAGRPAIPLDPPILTASLTDADSAKQQMQAHFELWHTNGTEITERYTEIKKAGDFTWSLDLLPADKKLRDGNYSWRVRAGDTVTWSGFSRWCEFTVDSTAPVQPAVAVPDGQQYEVGSPATFTFGSGGSVDVASYRWSLTARPTSTIVQAASPTVSVPLRTFGRSVLRVWSYDRAGNESPEGTFDFFVDGGEEAGWWRLDEGSGTAAHDAATPAHPLTLSGGVSWQTGRWPDDPTDRALRFNGTNAVGATAPVDVVRTDENFSVAVWVKPSDLTVARSAVSKGETASGGFTLGVVPAGPDPQTQPASFAFTLANTDPAPPAGLREAVARFDQPAPLDEWVHLIGVYEAGNGLLTLYVDGEWAAATEVSFTPANSTGSLRLGRAQTSAPTPGFWAGDLDEVRVFAGALDDVQAFTLASQVRTGPTAAGQD